VQDNGDHRERRGIATYREADASRSPKESSQFLIVSGKHPPICKSRMRPDIVNCLLVITEEMRCRELFSVAEPLTIPGEFLKFVGYSAALRQRNPVSISISDWTDVAGFVVSVPRSTYAGVA